MGLDSRLRTCHNFFTSDRSTSVSASSSLFLGMPIIPPPPPPSFLSSPLIASGMRLYFWSAPLRYVHVSEEALCSHKRSEILVGAKETYCAST